ncbi:hypothetical protein D7X33_39365 [Butyricicoccus sp. 1XD8-22]|nr:hypothetical protein D7X33_39365 [Butyricicoccus sp. 1XD8-22]
MVVSFLVITIKRLVGSKKFVGIIFYLLCLPLLILIMNDWSTNSNSWNVIFFIFGNRCIYFMFIIPVFLILIDDIANEGNLRYCLARLVKKSNLIISQLIVMLLLSFFLTLYVFGVIVIESFLTFGLTFEWSQETRLGLDPYTSFFTELTPLNAISLYAVRFFVTLIFIGSLYFYWQSMTKREFRSLGIFIILLLLFLNSILNFYNIPILSFLDLSFVYTYNFNPKEEIILIYTLTSNLPILILSVGLTYLSLHLSKGVNF